MLDTCFDTGVPLVVVVVGFSVVVVVVVGIDPDYSQNC